MGRKQESIKIASLYRMTGKWGPPFILRCTFYIREATSRVNIAFSSMVDEFLLWWVATMIVKLSKTIGTPKAIAMIVLKIEQFRITVQ